MSGIYSAVYSGVAVYEMIVRDVPMMRRITDSYMNATQILKLAGFQKPKRTKILEKEVLQNGIYEKIQGGYGKYQGTWIPLDAAIALATKFNIEDLLNPVFYFDPSLDELEEKPLTAKASPQTGTPRPGRPSRTYKDLSFQSPQTGDEDYDANGLGLYSNFDDQDPIVWSTPKSRASSPRKGRVGRKPANNWSYEIDSEFKELYPLTVKFSDYLREIDLKFPYESPSIPINIDASKLSNTQLKKEIRLKIFLNGDSNIHTIMHLLNSSNQPIANVDMAIDIYGSTPLHFASAHAQLKLVGALLENGADDLKLDENGDSALMRAITLPDNYKAQTFPELIVLLCDSFYSSDVDGQTILHHVAQSSCNNLLWKYTRYYGQCIIEFLKSEIRSGTLVTDFIDKQDINGNTALHLACKQRNYKLVDLLLGLDARTDILNWIGKSSAWLSRKDYRLVKIFEMAKSDLEHGHSSRIVFQSNLIDDDIPSPVDSDDSEDEDVSNAAKQLMHARTISQMNTEFGEYVPEILDSLSHIKPSNCENIQSKDEFLFKIGSRQELNEIDSKKEKMEELYQEASLLKNESNLRFPAEIDYFELLRDLPDGLEELKQEERSEEEEEGYNSLDEAKRGDALVQISELQDRIGISQESKKRMFDELGVMQEERRIKDCHYNHALSSLGDTNLFDADEWIKDNL